MRFDVITLFPELFAPHFVHGVTRRAFESGQVEVKLWQLRDFGDPPHARVDDRPYGGGPGDGAAGRAAAARGGGGARRSRRDRAGAAGQLLAGRAAALRRRRSSTSLPAAARSCSAPATKASTSASSMPRSTPRSASATTCSRAARSRRSPCSTRWRGSSPASWATCARTSRTASPPACSTARTTAGRSSWPRAARAAVPPVLLSGNHAAIERWRRDQSLALTAGRRPDLVAAAEAEGRLDRGRPGGPGPGEGRKAIIPGFPILCHAGPPSPHTNSTACARSPRSTPWT